MTIFLIIIFTYVITAHYLHCLVLFQGVIVLEAVSNAQPHIALGAFIVSVFVHLRVSQGTAEHLTTPLPHPLSLSPWYWTDKMTSCQACLDILRWRPHTFFPWHA